MINLMRQVYYHMPPVTIIVNFPTWLFCFVQSIVHLAYYENILHDNDIYHLLIF